MPVQSFIKHFRAEFEYHIEHKRCVQGRRYRAQVPRGAHAIYAVSRLDAEIEIDGREVECRRAPR
jgi:hypothetical protein